MKSTFSVIYYLKRQVVKKDGTVPVMGRITVDGSQTQFSCKLTVDPKLWDTKGGRVTGRSSAALETNRMLDKMRVRINKHYQEIMERDNFVTAEKVKNAFLGLEHRYHTLMQVFRQHNEDYEKQVDAGMKAKGTLLKYRTVYKHLQEFLTIRYRVKDIALKELTPAFISDFEMFLRTDKHCCTNTVWLYVCPLRTMVFIAINNEWLTRDPFREYEIKKEETTRSFLTKEEIRLLMEGTHNRQKSALNPPPIAPPKIPTPNPSNGKKIKTHSYHLFWARTILFPSPSTNVTPVMKFPFTVMSSSAPSRLTTKTFLFLFSKATPFKVNSFLPVHIFSV